MRFEVETNALIGSSDKLYTITYRTREKAAETEYIASSLRHMSGFDSCVSQLIRQVDALLEETSALKNLAEAIRSVSESYAGCERMLTERRNAKPGLFRDKSFWQNSRMMEFPFINIPGAILKPPGPGKTLLGENTILPDYRNLQQLGDAII